MTRINLVEPKQLTNEHLMAEYRELPRIFTAVRNAVDKDQTPADIDIPEQYVLGTGHMKFFYNKLSYLLERYTSLYKELIDRNYNIDKAMYADIMKAAIALPGEWFNTYEPDPEAIYLNMARLCIRSNLPRVLIEVN